MDDNEVTATPDVIGLIFHPDLIYGTPLADKMSSFSFFDYSNMEALHLSDDEKTKFLDCLAKIKEESEHPVDHHSAALLSVNIQVLLEYLHRFYDRQFITRHKVNSEIVTRFEHELKSYYDTHRGGIPSVAYFASRLNLSAGYFGDLIRKETGSTPKDLITLHLISIAKHRLATGNDDVSVIAYDLGFDYPAHFSRMFKRLTGQTPDPIPHIATPLLNPHFRHEKTSDSRITSDRSTQKQGWLCHAPTALSDIGFFLMENQDTPQLCQPHSPKQQCHFQNPARTMGS